MLQPALAVALSLLAQAEPAAPAKVELVPEAPPGVRIEYPTDIDNPPAGTPEELKLWRAGIDSLTRVTLVRRQAVLLRASGKYQALGAQLGAARARAEHEEAERLEKVGRRYEKAWDENVEIYSRRWPVDPTRVCGYPLMNYDSALRIAPGPNRQAEVSNTIEPLRACVKAANDAADRMEASNKRLAEASEEALKAIVAAQAHERHEAQEKAEKHEHKGGEGK